MSSGEEGYHKSYLKNNIDESKDRFAAFLVTDFNESNYDVNELTDFKMAATDLLNEAIEKGDKKNKSRYEHILYNIDKQLSKKSKAIPIRSMPMPPALSRRTRRRSRTRSRSRSRSPVGRLRLDGGKRSGKSKRKRSKTHKRKL